jgi:hypothetical protein
MAQNPGQKHPPEEESDDSRIRLPHPNFNGIINNNEKECDKHKSNKT